MTRMTACLYLLIQTRGNPPSVTTMSSQHKHKSEHFRIERQIEKVKRQSARKNLILPGIGGRRESARSEKAHHGPIVNRARCEQYRHDCQSQGNQTGIQAMIALKNPCEVKPSRVGCP